MPRSPEYSDLPWVEPRAWGSGRDGKAVRFIVIHYTAGAEGRTSAEDGAAYDQRRTDGTSCHYFVDRDTVVQCVRTRDRANAARHKGNRLGIQYELCGTVQTRAQWLDAASMATLHNAARQVARDCRKYGIPARRLTVAETRRAWTEFPNGPKGIVGHVDCTDAYPEDGGDHTDPGTAFPWDIFLGFVQAALEEDDMPTLKEIQQAVWLGDDVKWGDKKPSDLLASAARADAALTAIAQNAAAEAQRDAAAAARDAGMMTLLQTIAAANGALTDVQLAALAEQVRIAASEAGQAAVQAITEDLASLRHHLGDND